MLLPISNVNIRVACPSQIKELKVLKANMEVFNECKEILRSNKINKNELALFFNPTFSKHIHVNRMLGVV